MPTAEEMVKAQEHVREWYRKYLIRVHGNNPTLIDLVMQRSTYDQIREIYVRETGAYSGPYSAI